MKDLSIKYEAILADCINIESNTQFPGPNYAPSLKRIESNTKKLRYPIKIEYKIVDNKNFSKFFKDIDYSNSFYKWYQHQDGIIYKGKILQQLLAFVSDIRKNSIQILANKFYYRFFANNLSSIGHVLAPQKILGDLITIKLIENDFIPCHCSTCCDENGAVLVFAPPDTGKTYTFLKMLDKGFRYISEDICFVSRKDFQVFYNPYTLTLDDKKYLRLSNLEKVKQKLFSTSMPLINIKPPIKPIWTIFPPEKIATKSPIKTIILLDNKSKKIELLGREEAFHYLKILNSTEFDIPTYMSKVFSFFTHEDMESNIFVQFRKSLSDLTNNEKITFARVGTTYEGYVNDILKVHQN